MSLNKVMLIGNVGKDPDVRYLESNPNNPGSNAKVASFPLATSERYRDRNGELRENTEWHNIVAWRNSADVAEKFIRKGTQVTSKDTCAPASGQTRPATNVIQRKWW